MSDNKSYKNIKVQTQENSEIVIEGEIIEEKMEEMRKKAVEKIQKTVEVPGFRKGNVPEDVLVNKVGEMSILQEAAEMALQEAYPHILSENNIEAIGYPQINITKIAPNSPLGFKIKTAVMPEIKIGDYKKIAKEATSGKKEVKVESREVDEAIENIRKNVATQEAAQKAKSENTEMPKQEDLVLPELNQDFLKKLGDFKTVDDLKAKLGENMKLEKERVEKDKSRNEIIEKIIEKSEISIPEVLVESELAKMIAQLKDDITKAGLKYEDYLKQVNKTEEDIRKEWRSGAEKRAKMQLILNKIATEEKIVPEKDQVEKEVEHLLKHYPEASKDRVQVYVETMLTNEKVFQFLEDQK